ncbi:MAG: hypothetical protein KDE47_34300, partial [Caldilineaceae bacterium]|nr:hypothetical protein [Caldilineaceae bacterium]
MIDQRLQSCLLKLRREQEWRRTVLLMAPLLLVVALTVLGCGQSQFLPLPEPNSAEMSKPRGTILSHDTVAVQFGDGTPWQVDWRKLNINLNEEGEFIGEHGEEPGEERYLLNVPYGVIDDGPQARIDYFTWQRAYPLQDLPDAGMAIASAQTRAMMSVQAAAALPNWENIGPAPMRSSAMGKQKIDVAGRTLAIVIDPRDSKVVYIGAAQGGVWKSTNGGDSWTPLTDKMPSLAIGALALDPKNPDILYAGTGEPTLGGDNYYGAG